MSRPIWKGHISFGLVNVPVVLSSAERRADLSFRMIDSRNSARVRYERVNEETDPLFMPDQMQSAPPAACVTRLFRSQISSRRS